MQPSLKPIGPDSGNSLKVDVVLQPHFYPFWHFHPEYEIMYVKKGKGIRYVGDDIQVFGPGDVVLLGGRIPHLWRSDAVYFDSNCRLQSEAVVVYFEPEKWGTPFRELSEMRLLESFLSNAKRGIRFTGDTRRTLARMINNLLKINGFPQLLSVFSILDFMSKSDEAECLASCGYSQVFQNDDMERMNRLTDFMLKHFREKITIDSLAEVAHMSTTAFCRYFRTRTNKTAGRFLNEIRVGQACNLLINSKMTISEVCFEVGFNNLTNFCIQFRNIKKMAPGDFRRLHSTKR